MKDAGLWEEVVCQPFDPHPPCVILLAAPSKRASPEVADVEAEGGKRATVGRHRVVIEVPGDDLSQPFPLLRDRLMHAPSQLLFDFLELRPHAVATGLTLDLE